jgi:hypothetical protein
MTQKLLSYLCQRILKIFDAHSECNPNDILYIRDWQPNGDRFVNGSWAPCARDDFLFSSFIRPCSSPSPSTGVPGGYSSEKTTAKEGSSVRGCPEGVDEASNSDTLFDHYLNSHSFSPPQSLNDAASELSSVAATPIDSGREQSPGIPELFTETLKGPAPDVAPESEMLEIKTSLTVS